MPLPAYSAVDISNSGQEFTALSLKFTAVAQAQSGPAGLDVFHSLLCAPLVQPAIALQ